MVRTQLVRWGKSVLGNVVQGRNVLCAAMLIATAGLLGGCSSSSESAAADKLTANVGNYPPGPSGVMKPRVGVPPFNVQTAGGFGGGGKDLNDLAADQMNTLLYKTGRFTVIERTQLQHLLNEQNLEGIVKPGELAKPGKVRGVDYLLLGKVTNLRVKSEQKSRGLGIASIGMLGIGGGGFNKKDTIVTTDCGVDIRLVDPTTGDVVVAESSEFKKTDSAGAMGVAILGISADADASIQMSEDDKGKILRLALDDAVRKSLNDIDAFLSKHPAGSAPVAPSSDGNTGPAITPAPVGDPAAAKKFCPNCGHEVAAGAKFCPSCGKAIP